MPNESQACTLVPVEVALKEFDQVITKHYKNGETEAIKGKNLEELFHLDVKKYRSLLDLGEEVNLLKYSVNIPLIANQTESDLKIKLVDTPGPNEMKQIGRNDVDVKDVFLDTLMHSTYILFVIDVQYYKDEENRKLIEEILTYRPELKSRMTFILNKVDRLMTTKEVNFEDTIADVKNGLISWGIEEPRLYGQCKKSTAWENREAICW